MKKLLGIPLMFVVVGNTGCLWQTNPNPAGREIVWWFPGIGEWMIDRQQPSESLKQSFDAEVDRATSTASEPERKVVPITATVTDTP